MTQSAPIRLLRPALLRRPGTHSTEIYSGLFKYHKKFPGRPLQKLVLPKSQNPQLYASSHCGARPFSTRFLVSRPPSKHHTTQPHRQVLGEALYRSSGPVINSLKSSSASSAAVVLFCAIAVFLAASSGNSRQHRGEEQIPETSPESRNERETKIAKMTGESLPGRPGTLTAEQEESLKQFWTAVLQVFGLLEKDVSDAASENGRARSDTSDSAKPKKKRMSLFRKKDEESLKSPTSKAHSAHAEDDKYGQTKEFHDALANMSPESLRATFWSMVKHDHPDALLLRFLRARKWDVDKALVMMVSTMRWRSTEVHVDDDIMKNGELGSLNDANSSDPTKKKLGHDFLAQMRLGKSFLHGLDKSGRPMCFVRVRLHKQGEQSEESLERYTVFVIESARMILSPPVDTAVSLMCLILI